MRKLILLSILAINTFAYGMARDEIRIESRQICNDYITTSVGGSTIDTTKVRWQDSDYNRVINLIHLDVCRKSGVIYKQNYITTIATQTLYELPSDFLAIKEAAIYDTLARTTTFYAKLLFTTKDRLNDNTKWESDSGGQPLYYFIQESSYCIKIGLNPPPSMTYTGTNFLRIDYVMKVSSFVSDSTEPFNGIAHLEPYHQLIVMGTVEWMKRKEGKINEANYWLEKYKNGILEMAYIVKQIPDYRGGIISEDFDNTRRSEGNNK